PLRPLLGRPPRLRRAPLRALLPPPRGARDRARPRARRGGRAGLPQAQAWLLARADPQRACLRGCGARRGRGRLPRARGGRDASRDRRARGARTGAERPSRSGLVTAAGGVVCSSSTMIPLLTYGAIAIGVSFMCSRVEAAFLSTRMATVGRYLGERPATGKVLADLREHVERPLSAILTYNTAEHTLGAAGVGAEAQRLFGDTAITLASAVMTLLVLFLSEIVPKTLGALYADRFARVVAFVLPWMVRTTYPVVVLSDIFTRLIKRQHDGKPTSVSREEVAALARLGG